MEYEPFYDEYGDEYGGNDHATYDGGWYKHQQRHERMVADAIDERRRQVGKPTEAEVYLRNLRKRLRAGRTRQRAIAAQVDRPFPHRRRAPPARTAGDNWLVRIAHLFTQMGTTAGRKGTQRKRNGRERRRGKR